MELSNLQPAEGSKHSDNFRRGRGHGSGNGKTAGKGHKGQKARSGATRGFKNRNTLEIVSINVSVLEKFENGATVDVDALVQSGVISNPKDGVKILGNGELTKKLTVKANAFSAAAKEKIEAVGGTAEVI